MSKGSLHLSHLREGDVLKVEREVKVTRVKSNPDGSTYVEARDAKTGSCAGYWDNANYGTLKVTRVKTAKPKAGDVITGRELKATMWKRGTTFHVKLSGTVLMLNADGYMVTSRGMKYPIEQIDSAVNFTVLHVA